MYITMYNMYRIILLCPTRHAQPRLDLVIRVFYAVKFPSKYDTYVHRLRSMMIKIYRALKSAGRTTRMERALTSSKSMRMRESASFVTS